MEEKYLEQPCMFSDHQVSADTKRGNDYSVAAPFFSPVE